MAEDLASLIDRVEALCGDDGEPVVCQLQGDIAVALGLVDASPDARRGSSYAADRWVNAGIIEYEAPRFCMSIDAAMSILDDYPRVVAPSVLRRHDGSGAADVHISPHGDLVHGGGVTPAIAMCAAALRARIEIQRLRKEGE